MRTVAQRRQKALVREPVQIRWHQHSTYPPGCYTWREQDQCISTIVLLHTTLKLQFSQRSQLVFIGDSELMDLIIYPNGVVQLPITSWPMSSQATTVPRWSQELYSLSAASKGREQIAKSHRLWSQWSFEGPSPLHWGCLVKPQRSFRRLLQVAASICSSNVLDLYFILRINSTWLQAVCGLPAEAGRIFRFQSSSWFISRSFETGLQNLKLLSLFCSQRHTQNPTTSRTSCPETSTSYPAWYQCEWSFCPEKQIMEAKGQGWGRYHQDQAAIKAVFQWLPRYFFQSSHSRGF